MFFPEGQVREEKGREKGDSTLLFVVFCLSWPTLGAVLQQTADLPSQLQNKTLRTAGQPFFNVSPQQLHFFHLIPL
jgi:hypothetical protein